MQLYNQTWADWRTGGEPLVDDLLEAIQWLERMSAEGAMIRGYELRGCSFPEFFIPTEYDMPWRAAGMLYPLLAFAWIAVAPEPDKRRIVSATLPAAAFLPRVREIMGDAQQVAAILGL
jgi:hypothetical protein